MSYLDRDPRNRDPLVGFRVKAAFVLSAFLLALGLSVDIDAQRNNVVQNPPTPTPCVPSDGWQQETAPDETDETIEVLDNCGHIIRVHPGFATPTPGQ